MIYKPILFWVVAPFSISHSALWVSTLSLRSLTRACGSIGFYQTHVSNSSQHSNEPLGSERAGDEGRQVRKLRKWRKSEGKGKAKVRQIIMEGIWRWGNSHSLLKKFKNWFRNFYCSHRQQDLMTEIPFWFHFISIHYMNCQKKWICCQWIRGLELG